MDAEHHGRVWLHSHEFYEIVYIERGFSLHSYENTTAILSAGDLFIIRPGEVHAYTAAHHTKLMNLLFLPEALGPLIDELRALPGASVIFSEEGGRFGRVRLDLSERPGVEEALRRIRAEELGHRAGAKLNLRLLLAGFLVALIRFARDHDIGAPGPEERTYLPNIRRALRHIEEHYARHLPVREIAQASGLLPDYFARRFRDILGAPPAEYLKNYRLAEAMDMLAETDLSVAQVAEGSGFPDPANFSRQFRLCVGMSPTEFKQRQLIKL